MAAFGAKYMQEDVAVIAINSNDAANYPADSPEQMVAEGEARLDLAEAAIENSQALAAVGEEMIAEGLAALAAAQGALDAGEELAL